MMTPVSLARFEAVASLASSPVATRSFDMEGMAYVCGRVRGAKQDFLGGEYESLYLKNSEENGRCEDYREFEQR
jgi:hypothetical protein